MTLPIDGTGTTELVYQRYSHVEFFAIKRRDYLLRTELAKTDPGEYLALEIDGVHQMSYVLAHFGTKTNDGRGHGLSLHLIGVLQHSSFNLLRLFTITDNHGKGSDHIFEAVHRVVDDICSSSGLPSTFVLQLDNCSREDKNQFLMLKLEFSVHRGVFDKIDAGVIHVGHTNREIDQEFSTTSRCLESHVAGTLDDLNRDLR